MDTKTVADCCREIFTDCQVRENLIRLRELTKTLEGRRALAHILQGDFSGLEKLLGAEDPKIRKNAAYVLGSMETEDVLPFLFAAYEREKTLYVRADYLKAMGELSIAAYRPRLMARKEALLASQSEGERAKHLARELQALEALLSAGAKAGSGRHVFCFPKQPMDFILVTGSAAKREAMRQVTDGQVTMLKSALKVTGGDLEKALSIRCVREVLFPMESAGNIREPVTVAREIVRQQPAALLEKLHRAGPRRPFSYRLEIRGYEGDGRRGNLIRQIAGQIDLMGEGKLVNAPSDYELELRLLVGRDGAVLPMIRLYTLPDHRFAYRKAYLPTSMTPENAAAFLAVCRPCLREGAQVLDPFCGVGTLLIERNYLVQAGSMYGVDHAGEAIEKARFNTQITGMPIHYIQRDFFTFRHTYPFDEVITEFPMLPEGECPGFFARFFDHISTLLSPGAVLLLCTDRARLGMLHECAGKQGGFTLRKEVLLREKTEKYVIIMESKG